MTDDKRKEALEALERDWLNCGCMPCDNSCRDRKEIVSEIFKDVHETLEALTPQEVDVEGLKKPIPVMKDEGPDGQEDWDNPHATEELGKAIGWNACLDHLHERGLLKEAWESGKVYTIEHDGFQGEVIGSYITREGKEGAVLQQTGTRVVHVYGKKWLKEPSGEDKEGGE